MTIHIHIYKYIIWIYMWDYTMMSGNQTWQWKMMEDYPCIDDLPVKTSIYKGFPIAMFDILRVCL